MPGRDASSAAVARSRIIYDILFVQQSDLCIFEMHTLHLLLQLVTNARVAAIVISVGTHRELRTWV